MHRLRLTFVVALCSMMWFLCAPRFAFSQERMRIAWAGASPANSPIWVVQEKGFLKKTGLDTSGFMRQLYKR